jgi:hypothetical protein
MTLIYSQVTFTCLCGPIKNSSPRMVSRATYMETLNIFILLQKYEQINYISDKIDSCPESNLKFVIFANNSTKNDINCAAGITTKC